VSKLGVVMTLAVWSAGIALIVWLFMRVGPSSQPEPPAGAKESDVAIETKKAVTEDKTAASIIAAQVAIGRGRQERLLGDVRSAEKLLDAWESELERWDKEVAVLLTNELGKALSEEPLMSQFSMLYQKQRDRPGKDKVQTLRNLLEIVAEPVVRAHKDASDGSSPGKEQVQEVADVLGQAKVGEANQRQAREDVMRLVVGRKARPGAPALGEAIEAVKREAVAKEAAKLAEDRRREEERAAEKRRKEQLEQLRRENELRLAEEKAKADAKAKVIADQVKKQKEEEARRDAEAQDARERRERLALAKRCAARWLSDVPPEDTAYRRKAMSEAGGFFTQHVSWMERLGVPTVWDTWHERDKACQKQLGFGLFVLYKWQKAGWPEDGPPAD
jgi:hypothetical protein